VLAISKFSITPSLSTVCCHIMRKTTESLDRDFISGLDQKASTSDLLRWAASLVGNDSSFSKHPCRFPPRCPHNGRVRGQIYGEYAKLSPFGLATPTSPGYTHLSSGQAHYLRHLKLVGGRCVRLDPWADAGDETRVIACCWARFVHVSTGRGRAIRFVLTQASVSFSGVLESAWDMDLCFGL
jgi:hypothetical protein